MDNKGISGVITAVMMIALVMAATSIVWVIINNMVKDKLDEAGSCFDVFDKVKINNQFTCYTYDNDLDAYTELQFSIGIGDIGVDGVLVSVASRGTSKSFTLSYEGLTDSVLGPYGGSYGAQITLPDKNAGKTYIINLTDAGIGEPTSIKVAPIIGNNNCEVSDSLQFIDNCLALI